MHTINDVARMLGETYSRVWHAYAYGRVPPPLRVGRAFVLTDIDINRLRAYFNRDDGKRAPKDGSRPGPAIPETRTTQRDRHDVDSDS